MSSVWNRLKGVFRAESDGNGESAAASPGGVASGAAPEPVHLQHVWTAEPNAVKLQISRMIMPLGETREYPGPETAADSPLAQALFEIDGVTGVRLDSVSAEVFLDEEADWDALMEAVPMVIEQHLNAGLAAVEGLNPKPAQPKKYSFGFKQMSESERTPEEQAEIVRNLLDTEINPAVAAHGGYFSLVAVEDNNVYVQLGGGCQGCGMVDVTLRQGVEQRMKEVLPEMKELIDVTDHQSGENPYYTPGK